MPAGPIHGTEAQSQSDLPHGMGPKAGKRRDVDCFGERTRSPMSTRQETPESTESAAGCSLGASPCSAFPPVLDVCCGPRQMWFDKRHPMALYHDRRSEKVEWETHETQPDGSKKYRHRTMEISPDVVGDFTALDFPDDTFHLIAFDPPHFDTLNENARTAKIYGRLFGDWETMLADGFR